MGQFVLATFGVGGGVCILPFRTGSPSETYAQFFRAFRMNYTEPLEITTLANSLFQFFSFSFSASLARDAIPSGEMFVVV